jgi:hypothetical protein
MEEPGNRFPPRGYLPVIHVREGESKNLSRRVTESAELGAPLWPGLSS